MDQAVLHQLLREGTKYAPRYRPVDNSDHLPMTLAAMYGLGADEQVLIEFRESYAKRLHLWEPAEPVQNWQSSFGERDAYPALLQYFTRQLEACGVDAILDEVLPKTLPGIALDAFHPIIRLGYGIQFESLEEMAAGLAYMVSSHSDIPVDLTPISLRDAIETQASSGALEFSTNRFSESLQELVLQQRYPSGSADGLPELASAALDLYLATRNFFALHLVTSNQALRCAVTFETESLAVASMTGAMLASHLVLQSPGVGKPMAAPQQLDPEHAFKYVYTCLAEYRTYGDPRYVDEIRAFRDADLVPDWVATDLLNHTD